MEDKKDHKCASAEHPEDCRCLERRCGSGTYGHSGCHGKEFFKCLFIKLILLFVAFAVVFALGVKVGAFKYHLKSRSFHGGFDYRKMQSFRAHNYGDKLMFKRYLQALSSDNSQSSADESAESTPE